MNNSLFLRYYNAWREDPASIVFAPVADYFLMYGRVDDALKVCAEGLKYNQDSVTGRMVLVKVHLAKGELKQADEELSRVLDLVPTHGRAQELRTEIDLAMRGDIRPAAVGEEHQPKADPPLAEVFEVAPASVIETPDEVEVVDEVIVQEEEVSAARPAAWQTVTMAKIYAAQGHDDEARSIFSAILAHDPANEAARDGLQDLGGGS